MLQGASTDLNPIVPKAHIVSVKINYFLYKLSYWQPVKASLKISIFCTLGTNGLNTYPASAVLTMPCLASYCLLVASRCSSSSIIICIAPENFPLVNPFLPTGQFMAPQINFLNLMFNWCFIFQSVVLMFLYAEQEFGIAIMFRS